MKVHEHSCNYRMDLNLGWYCEMWIYGTFLLKKSINKTWSSLSTSGNGAFQDLAPTLASLMKALFWTCLSCWNFPFGQKSLLSKGWPPQLAVEFPVTQACISQKGSFYASSVFSIVEGLPGFHYAVFSEQCWLYLPLIYCYPSALLLYLSTSTSIRATLGFNPAAVLGSLEDTICSSFIPSLLLSPPLQIYHFRKCDPNDFSYCFVTLFP